MRKRKENAEIFIKIEHTICIYNAIIIIFA